MNDLQASKTVIKSYNDSLDTHRGNFVNYLRNYVTEDYRWRGYHPFNELRGADQVVQEFWQPMIISLSSVRRRQNIFFAGRNQIDGFSSNWVVSMGSFVGLFDVPFVGIPATGKIASLPYCEFHRVEGGKISETAMYFDLPHLIRQAGIELFSKQTASHTESHGPLTSDGLMYNAQPEGAGQETLALINRMISDVGQWQSGLSLEEELRRTWAEDMYWWGPTGIGSICTIERYAKQHSGPFRTAFSDRSKTTHIARLAEGNYGGFFGWPNFTARLTGDFMSHASTDKIGEFRVIDIYRRVEDRLAENWVFIDLLHFWKCQGIDYLAQVPEGSKS